MIRPRPKPDQPDHPLCPCIVRASVLKKLSSLAIVAAAVSEEEDTYSVIITTQPGQGPFRTNQTVQFSCSIYPTPPGDVTYQWRVVDRAGSGFTSNLKSFSQAYHVLLL